MACHSLDVAITVVAEKTRSRTVVVVHIDGSMLVRLVFLVAAVHIKTTKFVKGYLVCLILHCVWFCALCALLQFKAVISIVSPVASMGLFALGFACARFTRL
eukprot:13470822-Ditylum_brightwellii.AAC.1